MKFSVYGIEVADANEQHYGNRIADLLYGHSEYGCLGATKKDARGVVHKKCARIAVKALRQAKKL